MSDTSGQSPPDPDRPDGFERMPPPPPAPVSQPPAAPPPRASTNGMAVASLVLGILWLWWLGSVLALVFGYIARRQIDSAEHAAGGRGLAVAGIVLGWVGVATLVLVILVLAVAVVASPPR